MKFNPIRKEHVRDYLLIILGAYMMAFATVMFWQPHNLVTGGVSGLAIIIEDYSAYLGFRIPLWVSNLALNIPLFLLGLRSMGKSFLVRSLAAALLLTLALHNLSYLPPIPSDVLLGSLFGGVFCGIGVGLIIRAMASTGGTVLAASILHKHVFKHFSVGRILFGCDSLVILAGLFAFGAESAMYAVVGVFVATKVTDTVLEGFSFAKAMYIISEKSEAIAGEIIQKLDRGVTELAARGMFTKETRPVLLCVVSARELVPLKQLVYELDNNAFIIVAEVREVLGEGFKER